MKKLKKRLKSEYILAFCKIKVKLKPIEILKSRLRVFYERLGWIEYNSNQLNRLDPYKIFQYSKNKAYVNIEQYK